MDQNKHDIHLLRKDPGALVLKYNSMVDTIVQLQVNAGFIRKEDKEEYVHLIIHEFINRIPNILQQYNEKAMLKTYCAAVFRNLCRDCIRQQRLQQSKRMVYEPEMTLRSYASPFNELAIQQEVERFGDVLKVFGKKSAKLRLYLKAFYRLPLHYSDVKAYFTKARQVDLERWVTRLSAVSDTDNTELFEELGRLSKRVEGKRRNKEAIRKWIRTRILDLLSLLNNSRGTMHTEETLQLLAEKYFHADGRTDIKELKQRMQG